MTKKPIPGAGDAAWWDSLTDDEREDVLAFANTGNAGDYSYLDDWDPDEGRQGGESDG